MLTSLYCKAVSHLKSEEGTTAVEYAVMVALIAASLIVAVGLLRAQIVAVLTKVTTAITPAP